MWFVWIWEQTAIISRHSINWLVFKTETECVYCAVRTAHFTWGSTWPYSTLFLAQRVATCCSFSFTALNFLPSKVDTTSWAKELHVAKYSWEAASRLTTLGLPCLLWNLSGPPLVSILNQTVQSTSSKTISYSYILILFSHPVIQFSGQICTHFFILSCVLHAKPILPFFIW